MYIKLLLHWDLTTCIAKQMVFKNIRKHHYKVCMNTEKFGVQNSQKQSKSLVLEFNSFAKFKFFG
jgi:hypothetical protein